MAGFGVSVYKLGRFARVPLAPEPARAQGVAVEVLGAQEAGRLWPVMATDDLVGAVWLPGYPPLWWREAAERLLLVAPAPAAIACDPDPDGVQIAMQAGAVWQARGLDWTPWRMDAAALSALPHHRPLSERDRRLCEQLLAQDLPEGLHRLLCWMRDTGLKGEQEALFSQAT